MSGEREMAYHFVSHVCKTSIKHHFVNRHFYTQRHLKNFFLLFVSNVENLLAFMFRNIINKAALEYAESILGIVYLYLVIKNLLWFIQPLYERDEYANSFIWLENRKKLYKEKFRWVAGKSRRNEKDTERETTSFKKSN
mmetsp:Transcript_11065/g.17900  ORF Transcript_11065/g.17900 Transcript_11065/m.17900 type:complete len:139 (+) Transcript_11065:509-925(+)